MKILLDENVINKAKVVLNEMHHDALLVRDVFDAGVSDETVFDYACKDKRILITHNGRHFIILIPPLKNCKHSGFIWLKNEVNSKNYIKVMTCIGEYLNMQESIEDMYFSVKYNKQDDDVNVERKYPKSIYVRIS